MKKQHDEEPGREHDPRSEPIVELARLPSRLEADVTIAVLEAHGIRAYARHGDAGGWGSHLAFTDGHIVMVFEADLDAARELLATEATLVSDDPIDGLELRQEDAEAGLGSGLSATD